MLRMLLKKIERASKCFAGESGAVGGASPDVPADSPDGAKIEEVTTEKPVEVNAETGVEKTGDDSGTFDNLLSYVGSEKVNPGKRPLKSFNRNGMSKEQIDKLIEVSGSELFMSDEELASVEKTDKSVEKTEEDVKKPEENVEDVEIKEFLSKIEVTQDEFNALPKKVQEKLVSLNVEPDNSEFLKLKEDHDRLKESIKTLNEDPYIAAAIEARHEEIKTGKKYIADQLPDITDTEIEQIDSLLASEDKVAAKKLINSILSNRATEAVERERSVYTAKVERRELERDASKIFSEVGKIDKRLSTNIKADNWGDVDISGETGAIKIIDYCKNNNISLAQVKKFGADKLYKFIAIENGWDKERDANIAKSSQAELLRKLRNPEKAKTILQGRSSQTPVSGNGLTGVNRDELIEQISNGNPSNYIKMLEANDGNPKMLQMLDSIRVEGERRAREKKRLI
jgi:hypothetical protein